MKIVHVNLPQRDPYETEVFTRYGAEYICCETKTADEVVAAAKDAEVILFTAAGFTNEVFDRLPKLRLLVRYGMGYDTVDLAAARAHGVDVCNAPTYGAQAVAEHAFSLLMAANRKIPAYDAAIRSGHFGTGADYFSMQLAGKTLGILGFGRIARNVASFGLGFRMQVIASDPFIPEESFRAVGVEKVDFDSLMSQSDFISINAPLTAETYHCVNADAFARMKPTALLVNTARGPLIDEDALYDALSGRKIRAAGIDVWENYPRNPGNRLFALDNIVMTPHIAWDTMESADALHKEVTDEVVRFLEGKPNLNVLNRAK